MHASAQTGYQSCLMQSWGNARAPTRPPTPEQPVSVVAYICAVRPGWCSRTDRAVQLLLLRKRSLQRVKLWGAHGVWCTAFVRSRSACASSVVRPGGMGRRRTARVASGPGPWLRAGWPGLCLSSPSLSSSAAEAELLGRPSRPWRWGGNNDYWPRPVALARRPPGGWLLVRTVPSSAGRLSALNGVALRPEGPKLLNFSCRVSSLRAITFKTSLKSARKPKKIRWTKISSLKIE